MIRSILGIVLLLIGGGLVYFFTLPTWNDALAARDDTAHLDELIRKTNRLGELSQTATETYQNISQSDLDQVDTLIPDQIDNVKLILEVQKLAEQYGLVVKSIDVTGTTATELAGFSLHQVSFGASLQGDYADFVQFLEQVELSRRLIDPTSIRFQAIASDPAPTQGAPGQILPPSPAESEDEGAGYTFSLAFRTYWKQ